MSVPIHGNYHGYYSKRPSVNDPRLDTLPRELFSKKRVLDVGCNEGWVSCEVAQSFGAGKVVGVDIDDTLVRAAWRRRLQVWSTQGPVPELSVAKPVPEDGDGDGDEPSSQRGLGHATKKRKAKSKKPVLNYFPASFEHTFGSLPIPPSHIRGKDVFPHNVLFRTADWVEEDIVEDKDGYDVVLAFSISKWIHLNSGDEGLKKFFAKVHRVLKVGGSFVLEPQAWDTYKKAKRMDKTLKDNAQKLKLRPEDFEGILMEMGFGAKKSFGEIGEGGFCRPVDLYVKLR
ncbi:Bin3-domain-containing protein [Dendrothele bispora CBS 962.96]|uniref:RNA methyltransferase n=1 Tax=Dendrothele bispora (strain CBS 962.96) TaxID=1314807 RepID=A0A4S8MXF1_DENBC|nr:Bin3-domain-containing protein [Dendrothele bispora CBS 962.96]